MKIRPQRITDPATMGELIDLIEETHHTFTRSEMSRIAGLMEDPSFAELPHFEDIRQCFGALRADLEPHMSKEEFILFPYITALEADPTSQSESCFSSVAHPIRAMRFEHIAMVGMLETLRELTEQYRPAAESDPQIFLIFAALAALDADLVEHMHWEDNVLFPRALQLESRIASRKNPDQSA
jgi:regulator of cell morphogenesis and NO signaling